MDIGECNGHRLYTGLGLYYRLRLWAPTSASRAISAVAELLVSDGLSTVTKYNNRIVLHRHMAFSFKNTFIYITICVLLIYIKTSLKHCQQNAEVTMFITITVLTTDYQESDHIQRTAEHSVLRTGTYVKILLWISKHSRHQRPLCSHKSPDLCVFNN